MSDKTKQDEPKVDAIIGAAQKRFAHYGLSKTTMTEIASDIGMGKASLYYYFPDKETLFEAVIIKEQTIFLEEMHTMLASGIEASTQLKKYVKMRSLLFTKYANLANLRSDSTDNSKPICARAMEGFRNKEIELVMTMLQNGITAKEFKRINKQEYSELLVNLLLGLRLVKMKYKEASTKFDVTDYEDLAKEGLKVVNMLVREIQTENA
ncbi:MAG: ycdC [Chitinophagaceae bacterium]|nr:ycdC [Chitinophagaceae bacterium]